MMEDIKTNWQRNKTKILVKVGGAIVSALSLVWTLIAIVLKSLNEITALFIGGMMAIAIPLLQEITALVFGAEVDGLSKTNQNLTRENKQLQERLEHEREVTEWKLKTISSNEEARKSIIENAKWVKLNKEIDKVC
jgi:hypothetical protein